MMRNIYLLYVNAALRGLEFYIPIYALYLQEELFSIFNVTIILAINAIAIILLEIPTGALADMFGRKITLIGSGFSSIIFLVLIFVGDSFMVFVLAVIFQALGYTLASGTTDSLLYESIQAIDVESRPSFKKAVGILHSLWPIGASVSSIIGGILAKQSMKLPILVTIMPFIIAFFALFLVENPTIKEQSRDGIQLEKTEQSIWRQVRDSTGIIKHNRQLIIIFSVGFFSYAIGEVIHRLKPVFFSFKIIPVEFFGFFYGIAFGMSFLGSILSEPISKRLGPKQPRVH